MADIYIYMPEAGIGNWSIDVCTNVKRMFTPWTMKLDYGRWFFMMFEFMKKSIYKAFEPLTRCKPNVDRDG